MLLAILNKLICQDICIHHTDLQIVDNDTVCSVLIVNLLQNTDNRHYIAHQWGWDMEGNLWVQNVYIVQTLYFTYTTTILYAILYHDGLCYNQTPDSAASAGIPRIGRITLVDITGTTILVPYPKVKLLQLIWRYGTHICICLIDEIYWSPIFK